MQITFEKLEGSFFYARAKPQAGSGEKYVYSEWKIGLDKNNTPVRLYGILQDITESKLAELERAKITDDLIDRNKDLEQFSYIVSHNLRAPLANILGTSSELKKPFLDEELKIELEEGLTESVEKLDNVIKDLNEILRLKSSMNQLRERVQFSELVEDIKISIKNLIDLAGIEIRCDFSEADELHCIKSYLYSIFYNLISNSIKYRRPQVQTIIDIRSHLTGNKLELVFSDNGMGIDLARKGDQVFGLYKRFHQHVEGKGMGLFMVKTQAETLGGKISVQSEVNKGTEFKIEFEK